MAKLYPPIGLRDLMVTGKIRKLDGGAFEVPENEVPGLLAAGWSRAPEMDAPEIPEPRATVDELAVEDEED